MGTAFRAVCYALVGILLAPFLFYAAVYADHDTIPEPPPRSSSNRLQPLFNPDRTGITVSGLSSGGRLRYC